MSFLGAALSWTRDALADATNGFNVQLPARLAAYGKDNARFELEFLADGQKSGNFVQARIDTARDADASQMTKGSGLALFIVGAENDKITKGRTFDGRVQVAASYILRYRVRWENADGMEIDNDCEAIANAVQEAHHLALYQAALTSSGSVLWNGDARFSRDPVEREGDGWEMIVTVENQMRVSV